MAVLYRRSLSRNISKQQQTKASVMKVSRELQPQGVNQLIYFVSSCCHCLHQQIDIKFLNVLQNKEGRIIHSTKNPRPKVNTSQNQMVQPVLKYCSKQISIRFEKHINILPFQAARLSKQIYLPFRT